MFFVNAASKDKDYWLDLYDVDCDVNAAHIHFIAELGKDYEIVDTDVEDVPSRLLANYNLPALCEIARLMEEYGHAIIAWLEMYPVKIVTEERFKEIYIGSWKSVEDYAYEYAMEEANLIPPGFVDLKGFGTWLLGDFKYKEDIYGCIHVFVY